MFILGNLFYAMARVVDILATLFYWLIIARALISWVSPDPYNPIVQFLHRVTEPVLQPIRRFLPMAGIDLSPLIAVVLLVGAQTFLVGTLQDLSVRIR